MHLSAKLLKTQSYSTKMRNRKIFSLIIKILQAAQVIFQLVHDLNDNLFLNKKFFFFQKHTSLLHHILSVADDTKIFSISFSRLQHQIKMRHKIFPVTTEAVQIFILYT